MVTGVGGFGFKGGGNKEAHNQTLLISGEGVVQAKLLGKALAK